MKRGISLRMFLVLAAVAIAGCAEPPTDIIEAAAHAYLNALNKYLALSSNDSMSADAEPLQGI